MYSYNEEVRDNGEAQVRNAKKRYIQVCVSVHVYACVSVSIYHVFVNVFFLHTRKRPRKPVHSVAVIYHCLFLRTYTATTKKPDAMSCGDCPAGYVNDGATGCKG